MGIKNITKCLHCGKVEEKQNTAGKYCSNSCQKNHQSIMKYEAWKRGEGTIGKGCLKTNLKREFGDNCSVCGIDSWMSMPINLEVDHEDGDPYNNIPENLRLICPNCHSQTPSFKGRNKGKGRGTNKGWLLENQSMPV
jgi:Zn finger protein HypA/HybF involved in hydrogenase expression